MTRIMVTLAAFVVAFASVPANAKHRHHYRAQYVEMVPTSHTRPDARA